MPVFHFNSPHRRRCMDHSTVFARWRQCAHIFNAWFFLAHATCESSLRTASVCTSPYLVATQRCLQQQVCVQPHTSADSAALPVFACRCWSSPCSNRLIYPAGVVAHAGTDRRTDTVPLRTPCFLFHKSFPPLPYFSSLGLTPRTPRTADVTSKHIRFHCLFFIFPRFNFVGSVWQIKPAYVSF